MRARRRPKFSSLLPVRRHATADCISMLCRLCSGSGKAAGYMLMFSGDTIGVAMVMLVSRKSLKSSF
jgi:hypothetical protein